MQYSRKTLDPNTDGGVLLAGELNGWAGAIMSSHSGAARPAYAISGMIWAKTVSSTVVELYYFDGTDDILLGTVNPTANTFSPAGVSSGVPTGGIMPYAGAAAPSGWALCNGQELNRTTFSALFTAIGVTYGGGNGSTTFNVPDLRGRVPAGRDQMGAAAPAGRLTSLIMAPNADSLAAVGGSEAVTLGINQIPPHDHRSKTTVQNLTSGGGLRRYFDHTEAPNQPNETVGGGEAHSNTQPTIILNYIIKT